MPRPSAEARAAAALREGGGHPKPPEHLSDAAKAVWHEIVDCRPVDFFQPGAQHLLEQLCVMVVAARKIAGTIEEDPSDMRAATIYANFTQRCAMHCQKLRLSIQSALRCDSRKLDEKEPLEKGRKGKDDLLFGGNVVRF